MLQEVTGVPFSAVLERHGQILVGAINVRDLQRPVIDRQNTHAMSPEAAPDVDLRHRGSR
jgi:hypothetical protein